MIEISKATNKEALNEEWNFLNQAHYGKEVEWQEKKFRFKATENGEILGTIDGKYEAGVIYIGALIVVKKARGKGIGTMLIEKAEALGRKYGAHRTWLITGKYWGENIFYQKLGFKMIGELPDLHFHKDFVIYTRLIK